MTENQQNDTDVRDELNGQAGSGVTDQDETGGESGADTQTSETATGDDADGIAKEFEEAVRQQQAEEAASKEFEEAVRQQQADVQPASFSNLAGESKGSVANLDMILDIPVTLSVELGKTKILINDLLQLGQGSVLELEKLAGEPMEILVNGKLIARGEVVVVNDKFGVRLTDIVSVAERINQLK